MHHLHIARGSPALVAEVVAVGDRALADVGDNLHLAVRMRVKAGARRHLVVIPDTQRAKAHTLRVVVVPETEVMPSIQPLIAEAAEPGEGSNLDHCDLPQKFDVKRFGDELVIVLASFKGLAFGCQA